VGTDPQIATATPGEQTSRARERGTVLEPLLAASAVALATLLALTGHILHGGLYSDDWGFAGDYLYADPPRYVTAVGQLLDLSGGRPLLALLHPLPYAIFGADPTRHLVLAAVLSAVTALTFYVLLRTIGLGLADALLVSLLALAFPWSDSTKLWPTAAINNVALIFLLLGVIVALRGLKVPGRRGYALHAGAALFYLLGVLTYEAVAAAAFLAGALYLGRAPRRSALTRWAVDAVVLVGALIYDWIATAHARGVPSLRARIEDVGHLGREATWLLARAIFPAAESRVTRDVVLLVIASTAGVALLRRSEARVRRWLEIGAVGAATIATAYAAFAGSGLSPLSRGVDNRGNMVAALGFALVAYAIIRLATLLVLPNRPAASATAAALAGVALVIWYGKLVRDDAALWDLAASQQARILSLLREAVPRPAHGTTIFLYGAPPQVAPGVPVFSEIWDFNGAVKLLYHDGSLRAFPAPEGGSHCGPIGLPRPLGTRYNEPDTARYGRIIAFDAATGRAVPIRSAAECASASRSFGRRSGR
jgi:hypothetical protein